MVSEKSIKLFGWFSNIGSRLGVFPIVWNPVTLQFDLKKRKQKIPWNRGIYFDLYRISPIVCFLFQAFYFCYSLAFLIFGDYAGMETDVCLSLFIMIGFYMSLSVQLIQFVFNSNPFRKFYNAFIQLDLNLREYRVWVNRDSFVYKIICNYDEKTCGSFGIF